MSYESDVSDLVDDMDGTMASGEQAIEIAREADAEIYNLRTKLAAETKRADDAEAEVSGWVKSFEVYHDAEMRARKLWQEANNEPMVWPDKARMTIWLLERAQSAEAQRDRLAELLQDAIEGNHMPTMEEFDATLAEMEKQDG